MADTATTVSSPVELTALLDANAGNIQSTTWDAVADVMTITLVGGDTISVTHSATPSTAVIPEDVVSRWFPQEVEKDDVRTKMFAPTEYLKAELMLAGQQNVPFSKMRRYVMQPTEHRACSGSCSCSRR